MSVDQAAAERRRHNRDDFPSVAWLTVVEDDGAVGDAWECRTFDLSRSGIGLQSPRQIVVGPAVAVEIMDGRGARHTVLYGVIRQCREVDGSFLIGVEFSQIEMSRALQSHLERWQDRQTEES